jgi:hypothetical protein
MYVYTPRRYCINRDIMSVVIAGAGRNCFNKGSYLYHTEFVSIK